jgi:putative alpha-1,2-mannosidase
MLKLKGTISDVASSCPAKWIAAECSHCLSVVRCAVFSGRGCTVYQDISFMPYMGTVRVSPATHARTYYARFSHSSEMAQPGYYKVHLDAPDVTTELSVTPHTGIGRFTYPASSSSTMLMNVGASANGTTHASVNIDTSNRMITGSATSTVGGGSEHYTVYFAAAFDHAFTGDGQESPRD